MRNLIVLLFILINCQSKVSAVSFSDKHPDTYLSIIELAHKYGYPIESHEVVTEDGYKLTMYRIPHGKNDSDVNSRPILMMHGLFGQAENYIVNGMHNGSLAYLMADNGYDVWLGNARGNTHSRKHVELDPNLQKFWNFSWHEIGIYDLPAKVDYILLKTKKKKIFYVGHSQGGTAFYVMCSEKPDYQKKIAAASLLSPAAHMTHTSWPLFRYLAYRNRELLRSAERNKQYEFPNQKNSFKNIFNTLCINNPSFNELCHSILNEFNGGESGELNPDMVSLIVQCLPTVSIRQILHYFQEVVSGHFRKWDYGSREKNMEAYGVPEPPDYSLQNISVPLEMYTGQGDNLVSYKDTRVACKQLANCRANVVLPNPKWTHIDFIFATNLVKYVNEPVLRFLNKFEI